MRRLHEPAHDEDQCGEHEAGGDQPLRRLPVLLASVRCALVRAAAMAYAHQQLTLILRI